MTRAWYATVAVATGFCVCACARADEAEDVFQSLYGAEYRRVLNTRERTDDVALARQLGEAAKSAGKQPGLQALLCERAYRLGSKHPDGYDAAIGAMEQLAAHSPAHRDDCRTKALALRQTQFTTSRREQRSVAGDVLIGCLMRFAEEDLRGERYSDAVKFLRRASFVARSIRSVKAGAIVEKLKAAIALERTEKDIVLAKASLRADPKDGAARNRLVRLYLVEKNDPNTAARYVGPGCEEAVKTYLPLAVQPTVDLPDTVCLQLADWYRSLADGATAAARPGMLGRARGYYVAFLDKHTAADLLRTKAELALKKLDRAGGVSPAPLGVATPVSPVRARTRSGRGPGPFGSMALVGEPGAITGGRPWTVELRRPRDRVNSVAYSRDGRHVAAAGLEGVVRIYDAGTGQLLRVLIGHEGPVHGLAYSPHGGMLASAGGDKVVFLWDAQTGRGLRRLEGHEGAVLCVHWAEDGKLLASGGSEGKAILWYPRSGKQRASLEVGNESVRGVACSPNGRWLATSYRGDVMVWTVNGHKRDTIRAGASPCALAWSPDSLLLAYGAVHEKQNGVHLWNARFREVARRLPGDTHRLSGLAWSRDGTRLAVQGKAGVVQVWNTATWKVAAVLTVAGKWYNADCPAEISWSPDGKALAACANSHLNEGVTKTGVWSTETGRERWSHEAHVPRITAMAYSPDGRAVAYAARQWQKPHALSVCDLRTGQIRRQWDPKGEVRVLAWAPDGKCLACGTGGTLTVWDDRGEARHTLKGEGRDVAGIAWSPDGKRLAVCRQRAQLQVLDAGTGEVVREFRGKDDCASDVDWSADGKWIAVATRDGGNRVYVWESTVDRAPDMLSGHRSAVCAAAWSPNGKQMVTASEDRTVRLWALSPCRPLKTLTGHECPVRAVAWAPDGRMIASADGPREGAACVCLWNAKDGSPLATLHGHGWPAVALAFSADSQTLASAGWKTIRLWNPAARRSVLTLLPVAGAAQWAVSSDGHFRLPEGLDAEEEVVYVVRTKAGLEMHLPSAFTAKYGWRNDPAKAGL